MPLPSDEATPPVIKIYFVSIKKLQNLTLSAAKLHQNERFTLQIVPKRNYIFTLTNTLSKNTPHLLSNEKKTYPASFQSDTSPHFLPATRPPALRAAPCSDGRIPRLHGSVSLSSLSARVCIHAHIYSSHTNWMLCTLNTPDTQPLYVSDSQYPFIPNLGVGAEIYPTPQSAIWVLGWV